jgi:hypothetical protein
MKKPTLLGLTAASLASMISLHALGLAPSTDPASDPPSSELPAAQVSHQIVSADVAPSSMYVANAGVGAADFTVKADNFSPPLVQNSGDQRAQGMTVETLRWRATTYPGYKSERIQLCYYPPGTAVNEDPDIDDPFCVGVLGTKGDSSQFAGKPFGPGAQARIVHITRDGQKNPKAPDKKPEGTDSVTFVYKTAQ